jgi:uncharacterized surface protein with fasciclin (FAS1) repeats
MRTLHLGSRAAVLGAIVFAIVAAGCAKSTTPSAVGSGASPHEMAPFGTDCSSVPTTGDGSLEMIMHDPFVTAAGTNPQLATLVHAIGEAKLTDSLNAQQGITVFAPTNAAFTSMDPSMLDMAMHDPMGELSKILSYHVVAGQLSPAQLNGTHTTLEGGTLTVSGGNDAFTVNGSAHVVCGDVHVANATLYLIDMVLEPKS